VSVCISLRARTKVALCICTQHTRQKVDSVPTPKAGWKSAHHTDRFGSHRAKPFFALAKVYMVYIQMCSNACKKMPSWEQQPLSGFSLGRLNESQRGGGIQKGCAACAPLFNFIWISRGYCPRHTAFIYMHRAVLAPSSSCAISAHSRTRRNEKKRTH
jgi:hypothetical protein